MGGGGGGGVTVAARHDIDGGLLAELIDYTMSQLKSAWFAIIMQDGIVVPTVLCTKWNASSQTIFFH